MEPIYSEEVEKAVISSIWYSLSNGGKDEYTMNLLKTLPPKFFYDTNHRTMFESLKEISNDPTYTNLLVTLSQKAPHLKLTAIDLLNSEKASLASLSHYVTYLKSLTLRRYAYEFGERIKQCAETDDILGIHSYSRGLEKMFNILTKNGMSVDMFKSAINLATQRSEFIPTAFQSLNKLIGGFSRREISSIGGKSGHHKTNFIIANACESIKQGIVQRIHIVSVEHPGDILASRILSKDFNIPFRDIMEKKAIFNREECYKILHATYGDTLVITDTAFTIPQILDSIRSTKADQHIIDHAQEVIYPNNDMMGGISQLLLELKPLAREQNANILIVSQVVDKQINERLDSKVPKSHDFYNSSRIKQESRQMLVIYWKYLDYFESGDDDVLVEYFNKIQLIVYKSTYSGIGKIWLQIKPETGTFSE